MSDTRRAVGRASHRRQTVPMPEGRIEPAADILNPIRMQWVGKPHPLGATYDGSGTNFALFSSIAEGVELCLFGDSTREGRHDEVRIDVTEVDGHIWHVYLPEVRPGQHYGWRVHGPWDPAQGLVVQLEQAADRPLRQGDRRRRRLDAGLLRVRRRRPRQAEPRRQRAARPAGGRQRPVLRLGQRPRAAHGDARDDHLRSPRARAHDAPSGRARAPARHLLGRRPPGGDRPPRAARRDGDRADAGAPVHPRPPPAAARAAQLLGLQHDRLLRPPQRVRRRARCSARRRSSRRWSRRCTRRASR